MRRRVIGNCVKDFHDPEAVAMNKLRREVPSAFWLEPWKHLDGRAYYDVASMTTVIETND